MKKTEESITFLYKKIHKNYFQMIKDIDFRGILTILEENAGKYFMIQH